MISAAVLLFFASAVPHKSSPPRAHKPATVDPLSHIDADALELAGAALRSCVENKTAATSGILCQDNWHGFDFKIQSYGHSVEINDTENHQKWRISCVKDKMYDQHMCFTWLLDQYGNSQSLSLTQVYLNNYVKWGEKGDLRRTPLVRFDNGEPIPVGREAMKNGTVGDMILARMRTSSKVLFRFNTWPDGYPADIEVNTSNFREFEAIHGAVFSLMRTRIDDGL
jgi:hypothetical protein